MNKPEKIAKTKIVRRSDNALIDVYFSLFTIEEAKKLKKSDWDFTWEDEFTKTEMMFYKLCESATNRTIGIIELRINPNYVWVDLAEKPRYKTNREFKNVAEILFSFACKISNENKGGGYIGFRPKPNNKVLIEYYESLGAEQITVENYAIREPLAQTLINKYYENT